MFFHSIVRLENSESLGNEIDNYFANGRFFILPIVAPQTKAGMYLSDEDASIFLSEYSGVHADIIYLAKENQSSYDKFIRKIFDLIEENSKVKLNEPAIVIFSPDRTKLAVIDTFADNNDIEFKKLMVQIIDAIRSKNPFLSLKVLKAKISIDVKETIKTLIGYVKDAIIIFS